MLLFCLFFVTIRGKHTLDRDCDGSGGGGSLTFAPIMFFIQMGMAQRRVHWPLLESSPRLPQCCFVRNVGWGYTAFTSSTSLQHSFPGLLSLCGYRDRALSLAGWHDSLITGTGQRFCSGACLIGMCNSTPFPTQNLPSSALVASLHLKSWERYFQDLMSGLAAELMADVLAAGYLVNQMTMVEGLAAMNADGKFPSGTLQAGFMDTSLGRECCS